MKRSIYLNFAKRISPLAIIGLKLYTKITGRARARVLVMNENNEVLLVKGVISDGNWTLPGGGIQRRESAIDAAARELYEETGIKCNSDALTFMISLSRPQYAVPYTSPIFSVNVKSNDLPQKLFNPTEIIEAKWFDRKHLPQPLSIITKIVLEQDA